MNKTIISQQQIQEYIDKKKEIYDSVLTFLEDPDNNENDFQILIDAINIQLNEENKEEYRHFLYLIKSISKNHHHDESFFKKIFKIFEYYGDKIKQTLSNHETFEIFRSNKKLLLYLFESKIIIMDENIYQKIIFSDYCHFFYPELKKYIGEEKIKSIENELLSIDPQIFDDFDKKRKIGENDSYICSLIRQDSVISFIEYINKTQLSLKSKIKPSIFETNSFLIKNEPNLIEYSAFFGSIQIFKYLQMSEVKLTSSLWMYAIHSNNAELIHLLEYNEIKPPENEYGKCFSESIKCHHNDIANYIETNYLLSKNFYDYDYIVSSIFHYHNYLYFQYDNKNDNLFYYTYWYNYHTLFNFYKGEIGKGEVGYKTIYLYLSLSREKIVTSNFMIKYPNIVIPSCIIEIGDKTFSKFSLLKQVKIPSSIIKIGKNSFCSCESLKKVLFEESSSLTSIGENAFEKCKSLKNLLIPSTVTLIGKSCFNECSSITYLVIPSSVTSIEDFTFTNCSSLKQILIPPSVTSIGECAFSGCSSLKQITLPPSLTAINDYTFANCSSLAQISIPSSLKTIGDFAFSKCTSLTQIPLPSSLTSIGNCSFYECKSLLQIDIPSSVTDIEFNTFKNCSSLVQVTLPNTLKYIGKGAFFGCKSIKQITIPESVNEIKSFAFLGCTSITEFAIPSSVQSIGYLPFDSYLPPIELNIDIRNKPINKRTVFAIQYSYTVKGSAKYHHNMMQILNQFYVKDRDVILLWNNKYEIVDYSRIRHICQIRDGNNDSQMRVIAEAFRDNPSLSREHLFIITDGCYRDYEQYKFSEILKVWNINFLYMTYYFIGRMTFSESYNSYIDTRIMFADSPKYGVEKNKKSQFFELIDLISTADQFEHYKQFILSNLIVEHDDILINKLRKYKNSINFDENASRSLDNLIQNIESKSYIQRYDIPKFMEKIP